MILVFQVFHGDSCESGDLDESDELGKTCKLGVSGELGKTSVSVDSGYLSTLDETGLLGG